MIIINNIVIHGSFEVALSSETIHMTIAQSQQLRLLLLSVFQ